jgi:chemotaxis protein histidine kinase CheA
MNPHGITLDKIIPPSLERVALGASAADEVDQELFPFFEEEARGELKAIEEVLHAWDGMAVNPLKDLRRQFHTLKGAANSIGHLRIGALAGAIKDLLEQINPAHVPALRSQIIKTNILVVETIRSLLLEAKAPTHNQVKRERIVLAVESIQRLQEMEISLQKEAA